jgi:hypothetical protein
MAEASLTKRLAKQQQVRQMKIDNLSGLSVKLDFRLRPKNTFQQLDNFQLSFEGTLTKTLPATVLSGTQVGLVDVIEFAPLPSASSAKVIGYNLSDKKLYDILSAAPVTGLYADTSALITGPNTAIPFMCQVPGVLIPYNFRNWKTLTAYNLLDAVVKYSAVDGNLYIFSVTTAGITGANEQVWPASGTVNDGSVVWTNQGKPSDQKFRVNYLVVAQQGSQPIKVTENSVAGTKDVTQVGVSPALEPVECEVVTITPNQNGYIPQAGRAFSWTYYNPRTLHESSPSPISGKTKVKQLDNSNVVAEKQGSYLYPLPLPAATKGKNSVFSSYQSYSLAVPNSAMTPPIGTNFTHLRFYATKDGGTVFFLLNNLLDVNGALLCNSDGAVAIADLQASGTTLNYVPLSTPQNIQSMVTVYDGGGPINLAPDPEALGPQAWSPGYGGGVLTVVPDDSPLGQSAIEYTGTGAAQSFAAFRSAIIPVTAGLNYAFSGYIDDTNGVGGNVSWDVISPDAAVQYLHLTQTPGTAGYVTGTFLKPNDAYKNVRIRARISGGTTVSVGSNVEWSEPQLQVGTVISTVATTYPQPDSALVIPAPAFGSNDPPPVTAGIGAVYQGSLFLVDNADRTRIYASSPSDFESFPINSNQFLPSDRVIDPILSMESVFDRVVIGRQRSIFQITGVAPPYQLAPIDSRHGLMAYRALIPIGSSLIAWLVDGLAQIGLGLDIPSPSTINVGYRSESLIGDPILPLLQQALRAYLTFSAQVPGNPNFAIDDVNNNLFLLYKTA